MDPYFNTFNLPQTASDDPSHGYNSNDDFVNDNIFSGDMNIPPDHNYQYSVSNDAYDTSNNSGITTIPHHNYQESISYDHDASHDNVNVSTDNYQSSDNYNTIFPHNDTPNVAISPSFDYQQPISNANTSDHNYKAYSRYDTDQNKSQYNNTFPSLNSINITINSPQTNLSEIFKFGLKIIIIPLTSENH
jgi:hypothetical protein